MKILKDSEIALLTEEAKAAYQAKLDALVKLLEKAKSSDLTITVPINSFNTGYVKDDEEYCAVTVFHDEAEFNEAYSELLSDNIPSTLQMHTRMADNMAKQVNLDTFEELAFLSGNAADKGSLRFELKLCVEGTQWGKGEKDIYKKTHVRTENIRFIPSEYFTESFAEAVQHGLRAKMIAKFTGGSRMAKSKTTTPDPLDMDNLNP